MNNEKSREKALEGVKIKPKSLRYIILGVSIGLIIGALSGFALGCSMAPSALALQDQITDLQDQLIQKDNQIQTLQNQIAELTALLGPIKKGAWNLAANFGGSSELVTDCFFVAGTELRINWTWFSGAEESVDFNVYLYKEGETNFTASFINLQDQGTTFVHDTETANYYLHIHGNNVDQWTITIEVWIPE